MGGVKLTKSAAIRTGRIVQHVERMLHDQMPRRKRPSQVLQRLLDINLITFRLEETLYPMERASAIFYYAPDDCPLYNDGESGSGDDELPDGSESGESDDGSTSGGLIVVRDVVDIMGPQLNPHSTNSKTIVRKKATPGTCGWAILSDDIDEETGLRIYDIVSLGANCCEEGSSESSSSSSSSSESSKTAIVPASWTPNGYTAVHVLESPDSRFDDVATITIKQVDQTIEIDPHYVEICSSGTIEACGHDSDIPVLVGIRTVTVNAPNDAFHFRFADQRPDEDIRIVIRMTAIRKGFLGWRWPNRTQTQFDANNRFWEGAYPL